MSVRLFVKERTVHNSQIYDISSIETLSVIF